MFVVNYPKLQFGSLFPAAIVNNLLGGWIVSCGGPSVWRLYIYKIVVDVHQGCLKCEINVLPQSLFVCSDVNDISRNILG